MKKKLSLILLLLALLGLDDSRLFCQKAMNREHGFEVKEDLGNRKVNILFNGHLVTSYCYFDSSFKTMLFPICTLDGIVVTRGYPLASIPGERTDHPHHTGSWLNYESVNGFDFWNNSTAIAPERRAHYGTIVHERILNKGADNSNAWLTVATSWLDPNKTRMLQERTTFHFSQSNGDLLIDRTTQLTADTTVVFTDVKDGLFAIRVARELEMPSRERSSYIDANGTVSDRPGNESLTGMYTSSEGLRGDSVWSSQARWVMLNGIKDGKQITIGMFDHPANVGYPAYWHARGYGLFAINPLGRKIFSQGKETLNLTLQRGEHVIFRYRLVVHAGSALNVSDMERIFDSFKMTK